MYFEPSSTSQLKGFYGDKTMTEYVSRDTRENDRRMRGKIRAVAVVVEESTRSGVGVGKVKAKRSQTDEKSKRKSLQRIFGRKVVDV